MIDVKTEMEWQEIERREDWSLPVSYGLEQAQHAGKTYLRAWAFAANGLDQRFESDAYECIAAADVQPPGEGYIRSAHLHDKAIADAAVARAQLTDAQRSPDDMRKMADDMRMKACAVYNAWYEEQARIAQSRVDDQLAMQAARYWLRGMQLLIESGDAECKSIIHQLWPSNKAK